MERRPACVLCRRILVEVPRKTTLKLFGLKDIFTTINLLGGIVGICLCIDGYPFAAGIAVLLGYAFGDTLDGWVARRLNSANAFGSEYDTISDHLAHCVAPATIVYTVYDRAQLLSSVWTSKLLAIALAGTIIVAASIRHARNAAQPVRFDGIWGGLPRSVLGFAAIGYVNGSLTTTIPGGLWWGVVLVPLLSAMTLTQLPFASHRLSRSHSLMVRIAIAMFFVTLLGVGVFRGEFVFDVLFGWMMFYMLVSWATLTRKERIEHTRAIDSARGTVST